MDSIVSKKQKSVARKFVSRDFANQPLESTVFSRDHRVLQKIVSARHSSVGVPSRAFCDVHRSSWAFSDSLFLRVRKLAIFRLREVASGIEAMGSVVSISPKNSLRMALVGAMFFGVVSTIAVSRTFGEHVLARETTKEVSVIPSEQPTPLPEVPLVLGENTETDDRFVDEVVEDYAGMQETSEKQELEKKIREMVAGYPIEDMVPFILEKDRMVASFLIAIAKKESAWGKRVPLLKSHDCFNYWGYRGKRRFMGTGGHTCFNSQKDAVDTVSRRLEKLIFTEKVDTPAKMMVVWKCGYDCSTHTKADTKKWIQDVELYFRSLDEE